MISNYLIYFVIGFIVTAIGALPFGLVNLSVLNESINNRPKQAMLVAQGASLVEVAYGIIAFLSGKIMMNFISNNPIVKFSAIALIVLTAIFFLLKKEGKVMQRKVNGSSVLKGIILNLASVQVLIYWVVAMAVTLSLYLTKFGYENSWFIVAGIWPGKMAVLWLYKKLGERINNPENKLSRHMNQIIGGVLMVVAFIQIIKI
ncbi:MAG: LysE family transporter [Prolixibacteraceae bacterium]|jgi:threonine/homoserine/homoserine lactone efflux protein|nr:LysE family transporter [Prolixibacteraceae bacterium]